MKKIISLSLTIVLILTLFLPSLVEAATFNPNNIISNFDLTNYQSMSPTRIQEFLKSKGGTLAEYKETIFGQTKTAAQIIYDAGQYYQINPKVILTIIQKEQSLITDSTPTQGQLDWATGFGVCDSCSKDDPVIQKYKGFFNQVNWTAKRNRYYLEHPGEFRHQVGQTYNIDGYQVTIENQATANLYNYTPHYHGNLTFWQVWNRWFVKSYPDGSLLQEEGKAGIYLIRYGEKRPFVSKAAFLSSYSLDQVITVSRNELDAYETGAPIKFPNYALIRSPRGTIFLLSDGVKRGISSMKVFKQIGFNPEEVIKVDWPDINAYPDGPVINEQSIYPTGILLQSKQTGGVVYVENGIRHAVWSKEILKNQFGKRPLTKVNEEDLTQYSKGDPVLFKDGTLITSPSHRSVFVISNGEKRPIASREAFVELGYQWKNIISTSDKALELHPTGAPIDL